MSTLGWVATWGSLLPNGQVDCRRGKQPFGAGSAADVASNNRDLFVENVSIPQRFIETGEKNPDGK